jgi:hypothetical protein
VKFCWPTGRTKAPELGRHEDVAAARRRELFEKLPDQRLAAAHAVDIGRIEERRAGCVGRAQGRQRGCVGNVAPIRAELPRTETDFADGAAGGAEIADVHSAKLRARGRRASLQRSLKPSLMT